MSPVVYFHYTIRMYKANHANARNPPPTPLNIKDSRLLLPINRHHRYDPAPGLQVKFQDRMALHQPDDQFTGSFNNPARNVDERKPNRLHPPGDPAITPDRAVCNAEDPSATSEMETPAAASREDPSIPLPPGSQDTDKQEHFCCEQSRSGQNKPPPTPGSSESSCRQTPGKSAANPFHPLLSTPPF